MPDEEDKPPLQYRNAEDDRPQRRRNITTMITGMVVGALVTAFFGCVNVLGLEGPQRANLTGQRFELITIFGCAAIITGGLGTLAMRAQPRRFMLGGILLGIALTSIIEGICFLD